MTDEPTRQLEPDAVPVDRSTLPAEETVAEIPRTGTRADDIEIGAEIARGGMGTIYRGRDLALDREVAVKILQDRFPADGPSARRFLEEARITGQLQHPGVPPIHRAGTLPDGRPYLAMKLIKGQTLAQRLETKRKEAPGELLAIVEDIAQAVGYAHEHGVIHRDLKPANVMVGAYGEVQVMDWGLAKILGDSRRSTAIDPEATRGGTEIRSLRDDGEETHAGNVLGTPAYMPPEQAIGAHDQVDARSDVFGLGAILCTVLTGRPPYLGESSESTRRLAARAKLDDAFAALDRSGADPDLVALCKRCLAAEPSDRPADGGVVAREIARLRTAAIDRARRAEIDRAEAEVRAREETKRRRIWIRSVGSIAAVLAVGAVLSAWLAVKAILAEREASRQLALTRVAERKAHEEERNAKEAEAAAKASEAKAKEAEAKATDREGKERAARTEADKQKRDAKEEANTALAVKDFVCDVLIGNEPGKKATPQEIENHRKTTKRNLDYAVRRLDELFDGKPAIEAEIRNTIGMMYDKVGSYAEAEVQLKKSLALYDASLGPDHASSLNAAIALGGFYAARKRTDEAVATYERCLGGLEDGPGIRMLASIQVARQLLALLEDEKRFEQALALYPRAIAAARRVANSNDDTWSWRRNRASLLERMERFADAEVEYRGILTDAIANPDPANPLVPLASMDLQNCLERQGKLDGAEKVLVEEVERNRQKNGPTHARTFQSLLRLGYFHKGHGRYERSVPVLQELLRLRNADVEMDDPDLFPIMMSLGEDLAALGRLEEAVVVLERAEAIRRKHSSLRSYASRMLENFISVYERRGRRDKIAEYIQRRVEDERRRLPVDGDEFGNELALLGRHLLELRLHDEAVPVLSECLAIREKLAPKGWRTANAKSMLGGALLAGGRMDRAEPLLVNGYEGLLAAIAEIPVSGRVNLAAAVDRLILFAELSNRPAEAARWRTERAKYPREAAPPPRATK